MNQEDQVKEVAAILRGFVKGTTTSPANYVRNLVCTKSRYLEAFVENRPFPPFELEIQMSSRCNLQCRWCIGAEVQQQRSVPRLPDNLDEAKIEKVIDDIIDFKENGLGVELVKFSGFIGEPLLHKKATLRAMQRLVGAGLQVGLFTNGILMTEDTWPTLSNILYVNVSLDAGPSSYFWLKQSPSGNYSEHTFHQVVEHIKGLRKTRDARGKTVNITVSFVVVPGNHKEIFETTRIIKEAGADGIRFKCDIGGKHQLTEDVLKEAFGQLHQAKREFEGPGFLVTIIHSETDILNQSYHAWKCSDGCFYQLFVATIGSDGGVYLCDHNTIPGAIPLGSAVNESFQNIWRSERRNYLLKGIPYVCQCKIDPDYDNPCPPFGNAANFFLQELRELADQHGAATANQALKVLRTELEGAAGRLK